ncbi:VOC family protein [Lysobacter tyrosinilyticus]
MTTNRAMPDAELIPELAYRDVKEAAAWLCAAFGFRERLLIGGHRIQLLFGQRGAMVVIELPADAVNDDRTHAVMVRVDDLDAHHACAVAHGARILRMPADYPYGERQYSAIDPGGHTWTFSQSIADVDPASWGGVLVEG